MALSLTTTFDNLDAPVKGAVLAGVPDSLALPEVVSSLGEGAARAFAASEFKGALANTVEVLAPGAGEVDRLVAIGLGAPAELDEYAWMRAGGAAAAHLRKSPHVSVVLDLPGLTAADVAAFSAGMNLRAYSFDKYKTRENGKERAEQEETSVAILCRNPAAAREASTAMTALVDGVILARDLVNEPANALGPLEFVEVARGLESLGVKVDVLTEKEMKKLGMGALLGVAQGSARPARIAVMRWNGGRKGEAPLAFIGKGVVFDTGGNSMKTASGMEDMKGDMGGAAAVTGLMKALAGRKARVNVVGLIGLVENMVDGAAQRPGDIVRSMSGQTIEVMNTDAEGRLVLADVLTYCERTFKPKLMIDLATLTGAIMVALGQFHTGLFSNDDKLAEQLVKAGQESHERVWRMPMGEEYDKLINSKNADMKNVGGRYGGAITAAQFLKRFVKDTPWAHLDIAGTAMGAPANEINQSWGSGVGVRLLNRFVADNYEG